jgi:uncharacterized protein YkwD
VSFPSTRRLATIAGAALLTTALFAPAAPVAAVDGAAFTSAVNERRADHGRPPVALDAALDRIAVERAQQMADKRSMYHDMDYIGKRIRDLGICSSLTGEIIASNPSGTVAKFVDQWYNSDGHRKIMLRPEYTIVGGSWASGSTGTEYAVMIFVDSCGPTVTAGFTDIGDSSFQADIAWLVDNGITSGCAPGLFCPRDPVERGQMASFMNRVLGLPGTSTNFFRDDDGTTHELAINRVAAAALTTGCGTDRYCPTHGVSRAQMASFLDRALGLPKTSLDFFTDDDGTTHEGAINRVAAAGLAYGCTTTRFCGDRVLTREQMAAFLRRAFE